MLINDDSKGASDGKERNQLQAMIAVGSEFMTYRDDESTIQKSGEFVRIEKESGESQPRFVLLHETSQTYRQDNNVLYDLTGNELLNLAPNVKLRKRSRLYVSEVDSTNGDLPFREIGGFKTSTRISRFHYISVYSGIHEVPRNYYGLHEANYTAQAGKRRLFPKGDGKLLMVREVAIPGDSRYFKDYMRSLRTSPQPHVKNRGLRAARVEVVEVNPTVGTASAPIFSFDVHSGVGFDPTAKFFSDSIRNINADMYSETSVFAAFSGVNYGSSLYVPTIGSVPAGGDASDTYAVCEPGVAKHPDGREYTSIIAVYPAPDDVYDSRSSGAYRLTCKRTTVGGGVALSKISFPAIPHLPKHYLASRGMSLHRLGPDKVVLRVNVHVMQFGAGGTIQAINSNAFFMWTQNNGETWTYAPVTAGFPGVFPYGGLMVKDKSTLLAFSWFDDVSSVQQMQVHQITSSGTAQIASIHGSTFNAGLIGGLRPHLQVPHVPIGFGGAVYRKTAEGKKKRLWMQFDPYWNYAEGTTSGGVPIILQYPGSRPMLLVSDDGGTTWSRRLLPTPWSFRAGFVVAISEKTLAVPVLAPRKARGSPVVASIFLSEDGGDTWKKTNSTVTLPGETWADGQIVVGEQYWFPPRNEFRQEQDFSEAVTRYNRGELLPMVALRDADGKVLPSNPARPWMTDYRFKEPDYG